MPLQILVHDRVALIAVPTGVKIFNWVGTMWMGRLRFEPPMLFAVGFIGLFIIGGLSGIMLAVFPIDQYVTDRTSWWPTSTTCWARFRCSRSWAGLHFWFPKMTGRMLDRRLAIGSFWVLFISFNMTFFPMHAAGLSGMPRRVSTYTDHNWQIYNQIATAGALLLAVGVMMVIWNCITLVAHRPDRRRTTRGARTASSGTPPRRRRRITSTTCRRSAASGRCTTCGATAPRDAGRADRDGEGLMLDKPTARKNIKLALWLSLASLLIFAATLLVGELTINVF